MKLNEVAVGQKFILDGVTYLRVADIPSLADPKKRVIVVNLKTFVCMALLVSACKDNKIEIIEEENN